MRSARRVFLSHTSEFAAHPKSKSYVDAAKDACNSNECLVEDMSGWSAADFRPAEVCRRRVRGCDVYVGIIGFSYGSPVLDEPDHSYTELEFEEARSRGLHVLVYLLADEGDMPLGLGRGNPKHADRQEAFRQRLRNEHLTIREFRNPDELHNLIGQSLRELSDSDAPIPALRERRRPFMARKRPARAVDRPALGEICSLVRNIVDRLDTRPPGSGPAMTALVGPPGFGKTMLADWAAHELEDQFPDGVLRAELGVAPAEQELIGWCRDLVLAFTDEWPDFASSEFAGMHMGRILADRRVLLIIDDLWRDTDLDPFLNLGSTAVLLVTTRNRDTLPSDTAKVDVTPLSDANTRRVLENGLAAPEMDWSELVARTGGWPLLAGLVNGVLHAEVEAGRPMAAAASDLAGTLAVGGPAALDTGSERQRNRAIATTVELSIDRLRQDHGELAATRFEQLATFPDGVEIPMGLLSEWWGRPMTEVRALARTLLGMSLIESYRAREATIRVHRVLRTYLVQSKLSPDQQAAMHTGLLAAHRPPSGRWADLAEDADYLWRWVPTHLSAAGQSHALVVTLSDTAFLASKTHLLGVPAVLDDLTLPADSKADDRRAWFRRWSHLLRGLSRPADLAATLLARPDADSFLLAAGPEQADTTVRYAAGWNCPEADEHLLDRVLGNHRHRVQDCAWSPDGRRLAAVDGEGVLRVQEIDEHPEPRTLESDCWIVAAAWAPSGGRLAFGDDDGAVNVWTPEKAHPPVLVGRHLRGVRVLAWSVDGRHLASGGDDGVRVWDCDSEAPAEMLNRSGWVRALAWSPDGAGLACAYDDGDVLVWTPRAPRPTVQHLGRHPGGAYAVSWSDEEEFVTSGGRDGVVRRWPVRRNAAVMRAEAGGSIHALAWSPDGRRLACGREDGTLRMWMINGRITTGSLGHHRGGVLTLAWQPDGALLASGGRDGELRLWRVGAAADRRHDDAGWDPVLSVAWSADGRRLAGGTHDGVVKLWPHDGGRPDTFSRQDGDVHALAWSPDGSRLAVGGVEGEVRVRSAAGGDGLAVLPTPTGVRALAWSPVRADTLALVGGDGTVRIWHLEDATGHSADPLGGWCRAIAWSPDGRYLAVGDDDGRLQMWDTGGDGDRRRLGGRTGGIRAVAWDPAGTRLVTGHDDGTIRLWEVPGHVEPVSLGRHPETVSDLAWSADGSRVISIGDDGVVRSWTPETDPAIREPECAIALDGSLHAVDAHPTDGRLAVAGSHGVYVMEVIRGTSTFRSGRPMNDLGGA